MADKKQKYVDGSRAGVQSWTFDPDDLVIAGRDVPYDEENEHLACDRALAPADPAMVKSIMEGGIRQPIEITRIDGKPYVVVGRGRTIAAREVKNAMQASGGTVRVPCIDKVGTKLDLALDVVVENEIRTGDNPLNQARKMQRLQRLGATPRQIAVAFNCSSENVRQKLKLLELGEETQELIETGQLPASSALELTKLDGEEQTEAAKKAASTPKRERKNVVKKAAGKVSAPSKGEVKGVIIEGTIDAVDSPDNAIWMDALRWARGLASFEELVERESPFIRAIEKVRERNNARSKPAKTKSPNKKTVKRRGASAEKAGKKKTE
jgi:hypothetical protein